MYVFCYTKIGRDRLTNVLTKAVISSVNLNEVVAWLPSSHVLFIRLYIDEDVHGDVGVPLRWRIATLIRSQY
ncbi:hypothetical protein [Scytonema sp. NUACC26]|uniref:hypothetical protein n=1 Tax=Scytonema sp. NUACC26 TaxID=3140176 RepID=UPI0034DBD2A7